jgi:prepilin-type N-terminal cleavage/methylation domain-containing protein
MEMFRLLRHKVNGFTVMEIMVTMVISGIVVLTAFEFYNIFNKLLQKKNNSMEIGKEVFQFYNVFKSDAEKAETLNSSATGINMAMREKVLIQYDFCDEYVVRIDKAESDTFHVKVSDFTSLNDVTTGHTKIVSFGLLKDDSALPVMIEKSYPNDVLLNSTIFRER